MVGKNIRVFCLFVLWLTLPVAVSAMDNITKQVNISLETSFSVNEGKISPRKGDLEMCKTDNRYLNSALKVVGISLDGTYDVSIRKISYQSKVETLELIHYEISLANYDRLLELVDKFRGDKIFIPTRIPLSKSPTSCFLFNTKNKTNLLCQYGFRPYKEIPAIINNFSELMY